MFRPLKNAYKAGWRAGVSSAHYLDCPLKGRLIRAFWLTGWETGAKRKLNNWLKSRRVAK